MSAYSRIARLGALSLSLAIAAPAHAQFRTPITRPFRPERVHNDLLTKLLVLLQDSARQAGKTLTAPDSALCADPLVVRLGTKHEECASVVNEVKAMGDARATRSTQARYLPLQFPGSHGRTQLLRYLAASEVNESVGLLGDLVATGSPASAYVASDVISGLLGRTLFSITYARVVVRDTTADTLTREIVATDAAAMQRLLNNGGTVAARFVLPMYAAGGVTTQRAMSFYPIIAVDGPLDAQDSLKVVVSLIGEYASAMVIRAPNSTATELGQLELALRGGWIASTSRLLSADKAPKTVGFVQLGVGLRQNGKIGISVLYTRTTSRDVLQPYYPKYLVSFSALKL